LSGCELPQGTVRPRGAVVLKVSGQHQAQMPLVQQEAISTGPGLNRYLRVTAGGVLRIDAAAIKAEENLDGKHLLRCSDPGLSAEDIALGYQQLLEVKRGWRDL
jgi:hypothetical protein